MEPNLPASGPSVEVGMRRSETSPTQERSTIEGASEKATNSETREQSPAGPPAAPPSTLPALPAPVPVPTVKVAQTASGMVPVDDNPVVAADEDVIEREWVQKAKKIVTQTKEDPYTQEKEVSKLQADYIKKRYGKEIKVTND